MNSDQPVTLYPEREAGRRGFAVALYAAFAFVFVYLIGSFLNIFILPVMSIWWMAWFVTGFAPACLAGAVIAVCFVTALRRRSPALAAFRELGRDFWTGGKLTVLWCVWVLAAACIALKEGRCSFLVNGVYVFDIMVSLLLLYPLGCFLGRRDRRSLLHLIMDVSLAVLGVLILYIYYRFLRGEYQFVIAGHPYDFFKFRLQMGSNANPSGANCALVALFAVYRFGSCKRRRSGRHV